MGRERLRSVGMASETVLIPEPIMCRLCKGQGWFMRADARHESHTEQCCVCKGNGQLDPVDVDKWTFADLDEDLGPGAMGMQPRRAPYVPPNAEWFTWTEEENGRGYLWAELRVPEKKQKEKQHATGKRGRR